MIVPFMLGAAGLIAVFFLAWLGAEYRAIGERDEAHECECEVPHW